MTQIYALRRSLLTLAGIAALAFGSVASADPPSRVARLAYTTGAVSFSPAGETDWVLATLNRPLTTGDRLWSDAGGRAEIQIGGATVRMSAGTGVSVLNLDDQIAQLQLTQGALSVSVRRLDSRQVFEVDTPNLALTLRQPGEYRIEVERDGAATTIVMRRGRGEVYGDGAAFTIESRQQYRFTGTGLREYEDVAAPRVDEFDRWASDRDRAYDTSPSARYVSQDVVGYQDLDANGTWRVDASYGNVWTPSRVDAGWAPYRDGHWTWVDPWGWTWVDDAPWGFAVSHYGRWNNFGGTWGWVPGPVRARAYYAPARGPDDDLRAIAAGVQGGGPRIEGDDCSRAGGVRSAGGPDGEQRARRRRQRRRSASPRIRTAGRRAQRTARGSRRLRDTAAATDGKTRQAAGRRGTKGTETCSDRAGPRRQRHRARAEIATDHAPAACAYCGQADRSSRTIRRTPPRHDRSPAAAVGAIGDGPAAASRSDRGATVAAATREFRIRPSRQAERAAYVRCRGEAETCPSPTGATCQSPTGVNSGAAQSGAQARRRKVRR
jgi:hypothetical protein